MKIKCNECGWKGTAEQLLEAPNPFLPEENVVGCPNCKAVENYEHCCDHADCWRTASSGTPTPERYMWTCHEHKPTVAR